MSHTSESDASGPALVLYKQQWHSGGSKENDQVNYSRRAARSGLSERDIVEAQSPN